MVTKSGEPEEEPTFVDSAVELAYRISDAGEKAVRVTIAGSREGAIRRIILYLLVVACIGLSLPLPAFMLVFLLATTDQFA